MKPNKERIFYDWLADLQKQVVDKKVEWVVPSISVDEDGDFSAEFVGENARMGAGNDEDGIMYSWFVCKNRFPSMEGPSTEDGMLHYILFLGNKDAKSEEKI